MAELRNNAPDLDEGIDDPEVAAAFGAQKPAVAQPTFGTEDEGIDDPEVAAAFGTAAPTERTTIVPETPLGTRAPTLAKPSFGAMPDQPLTAEEEKPFGAHAIAATDDELDDQRLKRGDDLMRGMTKALDENKLFGSFTTAASSAAWGKGVYREDGKWNLPSMRERSDSSIVNSIRGTSTAIAQQLGSRDGSWSTNQSAENARAMIDKYAQDNGLDDEGVQKLFSDLGNRYRKWEDNESIRVQSNGGLEYNPHGSAFLDAEGITKTINDSGASPMAKKRMIAGLPQLQQTVAENKAAAYSAASIAAGRTDFDEYAKSHGGYNNLQEVVKGYERDVVAKEPAWKKAIISYQNDFIIQGFGGVANQAMGLGGMMGSQTMADQAAQFNEASQLITQGSPNTGVLGDILKQVPSIGVQVLLTKGLGMGAGALGATAGTARGVATLGGYGLAGVQSAAQSFGDLYQQNLDKGMGEEEARSDASGKAAKTGVNTMLITALFGSRGAGGVESVAAGRAVGEVTLRDLASQFGRGGLKAAVKSPEFRKFAKDFGLALGGEGTEEWADTLSSAFITADPDTNLSDAWDNAVKSGVVGLTAGGLTHLGQDGFAKSEALKLAQGAAGASPGASAAAINQAINLPPAAPLTAPPVATPPGPPPPAPTLPRAAPPVAPPVAPQLTESAKLARNKEIWNGVDEDGVPFFSDEELQGQIDRGQPDDLATRAAVEVLAERQGGAAAPQVTETAPQVTETPPQVTETPPQVSEPPPADASFEEQQAWIAQREQARQEGTVPPAPQGPRLAKDMTPEELGALPKGTQIRSDSYKADKYITITGPPEMGPNGMQYPAVFAFTPGGDVRSGNIQVGQITSATAPQVAPEAAGATVLNAPQERQIQEGNLPEYPGTAPLGPPAETGGGDRNVGGGEIAQEGQEGQGQETPQVTNEPGINTPDRAGDLTDSLPGETPVTAEEAANVPPPAEAEAVPTPGAPAAAVPPEPAAAAPEPAPAAGAPAPAAGAAPEGRGLTHAYVKQRLEELRLPPMTSLKGESNQAMVDEGIAAHQADPEVGKKLVDDLLAKPRPVVETAENGILLIEQTKRAIAHQEAVRASRRAFLRGSEQDIEAAQKREAETKQAEADVLQAQANAGSVAGKLFQQRQVTIDDDFSLQGMQQRYHRQVNDDGSEMSPEQKDKVAQDYQDVRGPMAEDALFNEIQAARDDGNKALEEQLADQERIINELKKQVEAKQKKATPTLPQKVRQGISKKAGEARQRIAERAGKLATGGETAPGESTIVHSGLDPEVLTDYAWVVADWLATKGSDLAQTTKRLVKEFGEPIREFAEPIFGLAKQQLNGETEAGEGGSAPTSIDIVKGIDPNKPVTSAIVGQLAKAHVVEGKRGRDVMTAVHEDLQATHPAISRQEVSDLFTGYGKTSHPKPGDVPMELRRVREMERTATQLKALEAKAFPKKTGYQRGEELEKMTPQQRETYEKGQVELRELQKQYREKLAAFEEELRKRGEKVPSDERRLKTSIEAREKRMTNEIAELQDAIDKNIPIERTERNRTATPEELLETKAKLEKKRAEYEEIFGPKTKPLTEEERAAKILDNLDQQIAEEDKLLKEGIAKEPAERPFTNEEIEERRAKLADLRKQRQDLGTTPLLRAKNAALQAYLRLKDAVAAGDVAAKGKETVVPDEELKALTEAGDALRNDIAERKKAKAETPEQFSKREEFELKVAEGTLKRLEAKLASGDLSLETKPGKTSTARVQAVRAQIKELNNELQKRRAAAERVPMTEEEKRVRATERSLDAQIAREEKMAAEGVTKPPKGESVSTPEIEARRAKLKDMRKQRQDLHEAAHPGESDLAKATAAVERSNAKMEEELRTGVRPTKEGKKFNPDAALKALQDHHENLKKQVAEQRKALPKTPEQQRAAEERKLKHAEDVLAKVEAKIASGDLSVKSTGTTPTTPQLQATRAKISEANRQLQQLRREAPATPESEARKLDNYVKMLERRAADYQRRLGAKEFKPKAKTKPSEHPRAKQARVDLLLQKKKFNEGVLADKLAKMPRREQIRRDAADLALRFPRSAITSLDVGGIGRQGLKYLFAHPILGAKNFPKHFAWTKNAQAKYQEAMESDPDYHILKDAGLGLTDYGEAVSLTDQEEEHRSRIAKKVPLVAHSERGYQVFMNGVRHGHAKHMLKALRKMGEATPENIQEVVNYVNNRSGRGSLGSLEQSAGILADIFFAPKLFSGRMRDLGGKLRTAWDVPTGFKTGDTKTKAARKLIAKDRLQTSLGRIAFQGMGAFGAAMAQMLKGDKEDEKKKVSFGTDFLSNELGKLRIGDQVIDFSGGDDAMLVLLARMFTGKKRTQGGKLVDIAGENRDPRESRGKEITTFLRKKLAPNPARAFDWLYEEDVMGDKVTTEDAILGGYVPILLDDIYEGFQHGQGPTAVTGNAAANTVGLSSAFYGKNKEGYKPTIVRDIATKVLGVPADRYIEKKKPGKRSG